MTSSLGVFMTQRRILVDLDGVIADFHLGVQALLGLLNPDAPRIPLQARQHFRIVDDYPKQWQPVVQRICVQRGLYRCLPLMEGAKEGLLQMLDEGMDVRICTTIPSNNPNIVLEKRDWILRNLGKPFTLSAIFTKDKTLIDGRTLIDDCPTIGGALKPGWQHVIFDQPYNRWATGPRMTWNNWKETLRVNTGITR